MSDQSQCERTPRNTPLDLGPSQHPDTDLMRGHILHIAKDYLREPEKYYSAEWVVMRLVSALEQAGR